MRTRRAQGTFAVAAAFALLSLSLTGGPRALQVDEDEKLYETAKTRQVMRDNCLICHSEEMTTGQRLTPAQWKAEVDKMVGWGAPITKREASALVEYLADQYRPETPPSDLKRISYQEALALVNPEEPDKVARQGGDPRLGPKLYADHCANCHGPDAWGAELGTNLVEKPVLLRPTEYQDVVQKGLRRMPAFQAALKTDQALDILAWLRLQRSGK